MTLLGALVVFALKLKIASFLLDDSPSATKCHDTARSGQIGLKLLCPAPWDRGCQSACLVTKCF